MKFEPKTFVLWMAAALLAAATWKDAAAEPAAPRNLRFGGSGGSAGAAPHPLYPALDMATLPLYGTPGFTYQVPALPNTTRSVTIGSTGSQAARDLEAACAVPGTAVRVPGAAGNIGIVALAGVDDCDVTLEPGVVAGTVYVGFSFGVNDPSHRVRVRGGRASGVFIAPGSEDIVFDGVTFHEDGFNIQGSDSGAGSIRRVAVVNCIIRCLPVTSNPADYGSGGPAHLSSHAYDVLFANNNIVTAGNNNSWGFRISDGGNVLLIDNVVRVSHHKLVRFGGDMVHYVVIRGGLWMREDTMTPQGTFMNDTFAEIMGPVDRFYIHDTAVYLEPSMSPAFGIHPAFSAPRRWEVRRVQWHALNAGVVSDSLFDAYDNACTGGIVCDYGIGTHSYVYGNPVVFPPNPWRPLPGIADPNPDNVPTAGIQFCGNGAVDGVEDCDDGNNDNGDGCAGWCRWE